MSSDTDIPLLVNDAAGLKAAVTALSQSGGTILIDSAGEPFEIDLGAIEVTDEIVITSSDPGQPARVTGIEIGNIANLTFENLDVGPKTPGVREHNSSVILWQTDNIRFENNTFTGVADGGLWLDADVKSLKSHSGLWFRQSSNTSLIDNEISHFYHGVEIFNGTNTVIEGNTLTKMQGDVIRLAGADGARIADNEMVDMFGSAHWDNHDDIIQYWGHNTHVPTQNIEISGNYIDPGEIAYQAIFGAKNGYPDQFENFTIEDNLIVTGNSHGISIHDVDGVSIRNNTVLNNDYSYKRDWSDQPTKTFAPKILVTASSDVEIADNVAAIDWWKTVDDAVISGNLAPNYADRDASRHIDSLFVNAYGPGAKDLRDYQLIGGSPADLPGLGSSLTRAETPAEAPAMRAAPTPGQAQTVTLDVHAPVAGATYRWSFEDGTEAFGTQVTKSFPTHGIQNVQLDAYDEAGTLVETLARQVDVTPAQLLDLDFEAGLKDASPYGMVLGTDNAPALTTVADGPDGTTTTVMTLDDDSAVWMARWNSVLPNLDAFTLGLDIRLEDANSTGYVFGTPGVLELFLDAEGRLSAVVTSEDGGRSKAVSDPTDLGDGGWHRVSVSYDGVTGAGVSVRVDDTAVMSLPASGDLALKGNHLTVGALWKNRGIDAQIDNLDLVDFATDGYAELVTQAPSAPVAGGVLMAGKTSFETLSSSDWVSVSFGTVIEDARVVIGPASFNGGQPGDIRVRNVTETGFEMQFDEWDYLDGYHAPETVGWIAGSAGRWELENGQAVELGRTELTDGIPDTIVFADDLGAGAAAFAQVTSHNGPQAVTDRIDGVSGAGFTLRMQEEEANDGRHVAETVDWLAVGGDGPLMRLAQGEIDHDPGAIALATDAETALLGDVQSLRGPDTVALRMHGADADTVSVALQEETSHDAETGHWAEDVALLALQLGSYDLFAA